MDEEIKKNQVNKFNRLSYVFSILMLLVIFSPYPLVKYLGKTGLVIYGLIFIISLFFAIKIEKMKKDNNIQTFKEIKAFTEGKKLDEIEAEREKEKREGDLAPNNSLSLSAQKTFFLIFVILLCYISVSE